MSALIPLAAAAQPVVLFNVDWILVLTFAVSTVLPLLVAIVTTKVTSGKVRGVLLALFSLLTSILSGILDATLNGQPYDLGANLLVFLGVFAFAVAGYFGIWRAKGADGAPSISETLINRVGRTITVHEDPATHPSRTRDGA